jgi:hypothetical protein
VRETALESFGNDPAWAEHATDFDAAWRKLEPRQLAKIRAWAPAYLARLQRPLPDVLHVQRP